MCGSKWVDYDPSWLVALAEEQNPELVDALKMCTKAFIKSSVYIYFVPCDAANEPGSAWQFKDNILLKDSQHGLIVLDLLKDGRVGGCEFLSTLLDNRFNTF